MDSLADILNKWEINKIRPGRSKSSREKLQSKILILEAVCDINASDSKSFFKIHINECLWDDRTAIVISFTSQTEIKKAGLRMENHQLQILSSISHNLVTPLNGMLGMLSVTSEESSLEELRNKLKVLYSTSRQLNSVVDDIIDLSMFSSGRLKLNIEEVDIMNIVEEVFEILKFQAVFKGIQLKIMNSLPEHLRRFKTDGRRLRQVLLNLIGNAIKFTREGGVSLKIYEKKNEN